MVSLLASQNGKVDRFEYNLGTLEAEVTRVGRSRNRRRIR
jgi:hypothetical protein